ncbi:helix-turn-helix domain-containing protein [Massilia sp. Bi118]|uniref:helix-turn-helix domain-containing protein n=1 Tax=Massilia sp. Bi118 TaxID=2822346 RepID=UPI0035ABD28D
MRDCLDRNGQNVSRAARELGVSRTTMYRLLDKHGMRAGTELHQGHVTIPPAGKLSGQSKADAGYAKRMPRESPLYRPSAADKSFRD